MIYITLGPDENLEVREKSIRKRLEVYTEVYIVFIFVYFHVILPYLVSTLLPLLYENMRIILTGNNETQNNCKESIHSSYVR